MCTEEELNLFNYYYRSEDSQGFVLLFSFQSLAANLIDRAILEKYIIVVIPNTFIITTTIIVINALEDHLNQLKLR